MSSMGWRWFRWALSLTIFLLSSVILTRSMRVRSGVRLSASVEPFTAGGKTRMYKKDDIGVSFTPAGLLSPFHFGASSQLQKYGFVSDVTNLGGSSGGALAAATAALGIDALDALAGSEYIARECAAKGTRLTLRLSLDDVLESLLPDDAHEIIERRPGTCQIAYTQIFPFPPCGQLVSSFNGKSDLVDCLRASCNIPFYFNGNNVFVPVRGAYAVDGYFAVNRTRFGCPDTSATHEILVSPFRASTIGLNPEPKLLKDSEGNDVLQRVDVISPELLTAAEWPFSMSELVQIAIAPPSAGIFERLKLMSEQSFSQQNELIEQEKGGAVGRPFQQMAERLDMPYFYPDKESNEAIRYVYRFMFLRGKQAVDKWYTEIYSER